MNLNKFDQPLNKYLEAITLTKTQDEKINRAIEGVLVLALDAFPDVKVYAQGSFATDTMVKPLTSSQGGGNAGEYDVDIALESESWRDALDALNDLADAIEDDDTFGKLTIDRTKNTCVRIEYPEDQTGVAFHIDLVPTKLENGKRQVPDRDSSDWKSSDAKQFAEWFNAKANVTPELRSIAIILKHLRDRGDLTANLKSILVLVLVVSDYLVNGSIMGDLLSVLEGIVTKLSSVDQPPLIANPVNAGENLSDGIEDYVAVRTFFISTKTKLASAVSDDDVTALKEVFGSGFEYSSDTRVATNLASASAAASTVRPTRAYGVSDGSTDFSR